MNQFESGPGGYKNIYMHKSLAFAYYSVTQIYLPHTIYSLGDREEPNTLILLQGVLEPLILKPAASKEMYLPLWSYVLPWLV